MLYTDWGPPNLGGWLEAVAILATGLLAFMVRRDRAGLRFVGLALALLLAAFPDFFFVCVVPAKAYFAAADVSALDSTWIEARDAWETGHALRFVLQLAAVLALLFGFSVRESAIALRALR